MEYKFKVQGKIKKPVSEVFDAVYNNKKLSGYFTTGGASGPLDQGVTVMWSFHDYPHPFPVTVKEMVKDKKLSFFWGNNEGAENLVEMTFEQFDDQFTLLKITESGWKKHDQESYNSSTGNAGGWMNMLCCLKVYLEHGKNLREGFFEGLL